MQTHTKTNKSKTMSNLLPSTLFSILFLLLTLIIHQCRATCTVTSRSNEGSFTGMFVFGASFVDTGNNNFVPTPVKVNYLPYGIDFAPGGRPTGRFTNGKNQADRIGDVLGVPLTPPFYDPLTQGSRVASGVNYASGGAGILDSTASNLGVIPLSQQVRNFVEITLPNVEGQLGCTSSELLPNYLFLISAGSNDIREYFSRGISNTVTLEAFTANLTSSLATQIRRLYNVGARKFALLNAGPLGCSPFARATTPNKACNETLNYASFLFNTQLITMLNAVKSRMPGFQFVAINLFQMTLEFTVNPSRGGFSDVANPCCEVSAISGGILCRPGGNVCANRTSFLYFDGLHPTETLYSIVAARAYHSYSIGEVYPYNLERLARVSA